MVAAGKWEARTRVACVVVHRCGGGVTPIAPRVRAHAAPLPPTGGPAARPHGLGRHPRQPGEGRGPAEHVGARPTRQATCRAPRRTVAAGSDGAVRGRLDVKRRPAAHRSGAASTPCSDDARTPRVSRGGISGAPIPHGGRAPFGVWNPRATRPRTLEWLPVRAASRDRAMGSLRECRSVLHADGCGRVTAVTRPDALARRWCVP